ncbi:MAG: Gfo/Idh/MocA family oxidoreductase [Cyclobacteriaceae bacterium]
MNSNHISWGIIGCGDVAEVKSGPAFNKVPSSKLSAVMRRDASKAQDFAKRHQVPLWYDDADALLANDDINAVYIATPPSSHLEYALKSLKAGKHVYLEKPMVMSTEEADILVSEAAKSDKKLVVAHYRRALPMYAQVKKILESEKLGEVKFVDIRFSQVHNDLIASNWRLDSEISGGGLFHDLAPHQLDLMYFFFGEFTYAKGFALNQSGKTNVSDMVNGIIDFNNGVQFRGTWDFDAVEGLEKDECIIYGSKRIISFSFYGDELILERNGKETKTTYQNPLNIQQPFIDQTVKYFLEEGPNPCSVEEGKTIISLIDTFTNN